MILIGFGSNLPFLGLSREEIIVEAAGLLCAHCSSLVLSPFYRSPAWPDPKDPEYINAVASIKTCAKPLKLLDILHDIEKRFGRVRSHPNAPRSLDLDLLSYNNYILGRGGAGRLVLPHPRLAARDFVLAPIDDVAPDWRHPVLSRSAGSLLQYLPERHARPLEGQYQRMADHRGQ